MEKIIVKGKALQYQCDFKRWAGWVQTGMGRDLVPVAGVVMLPYPDINVPLQVHSVPKMPSWYQCALPSPQCHQHAPSCCLPLQISSFWICSDLTRTSSSDCGPEIKWCIILAPLEPLCIHSANWKGGVLVSIFLERILLPALCYLRRSALSAWVHRGFL